VGPSRPIKQKIRTVHGTASQKLEGGHVTRDAFPEDEDGSRKQRLERPERQGKRVTRVRSPPRCLSTTVGRVPPGGITMRAEGLRRNRPLPGGVCTTVEKKEVHGVTGGRNAQGSNAPLTRAAQNVEGGKGQTGHKKREWDFTRDITNPAR